MSAPNPYLMFFGGALVGATAAVLLTPRSGPETRRALRARGERAVEAAQAALADAQAALEDARAKAAHLPSAVASAGEAAREAFTDSYAHTSPATR